MRFLLFVASPSLVFIVASLTGRSLGDSRKNPHKSREALLSNLKVRTVHVRRIDPRPSGPFPPFLLARSQTSPSNDQHHVSHIRQERKCHHERSPTRRTAPSAGNLTRSINPPKEPSAKTTRAHLEQ